MWTRKFFILQHLLTILQWKNSFPKKYPRHNTHRFKCLLLFFVCDDCKEGTPCLFLHWRFFTVLLKDKNPSLNYVMALMCTSVNIGTWLRRLRTKSQPHLFYIHKKKKVTSANVWFYDYLFLVSSVHYPGFKVWVCFYVSSPNNKTEAAANCIFMTLKSCSFFFLVAHDRKVSFTQNIIFFKIFSICNNWLRISFTGRQETWGEIRGGRGQVACFPVLPQTFKSESAVTYLVPVWVVVVLIQKQIFN